MKKYDLAVVIGRFQPWTEAHNKLALFASHQASNLAILCGSFSETRTKKNPLLFDERRKIIGANIKDFGVPYEILPVPDCDSDDEWVKIVKQQVEIACQELYLNSHPKIVIVGMHKDDSSYYLDLFKDYDFIEYERPKEIISATDVREILYGEKQGNLNRYVSPETLSFLDIYRDVFANL